MDSPSLSWRGKFGIVVAFIVLLVVVVTSPIITAPFGAWTQMFIVVLLILQLGIMIGLLLRPYTRFVGPNLRAVNGPEHTEYARICRKHGPPIQGVWVTDDLQRSYGFAEIYGLLPRNRHLFLDTKFFDAYTPDERVAVIAREAALADNYYRVIGITLVYLVFLAYFAIVLAAVYVTGSQNPFPDWPFVPEFLLVVLFSAGIWYGRRIVYKADRFAAKLTDVETVIRVLETFDEEKQDSEKERVRIALLSLFWTRPSPQKRIDRLCKSSVTERD